MDQAKIGELISRLRKERGFTQRQLAEQLHVSVTAVCKWEKGVNIPDIFNLEALAKLFKISVSELINGEVIPVSNNTDEIISNNYQLIQDELQILDENKPIPKSNYKKRLWGIFILIAISIVVIGVKGYSILPPRITVIAGSIEEPEKSHKEAYGFDSVYCLLVEYDGNILDSNIFEYNMKLAHEVSSEQNLEDIDAIYIKYYDDYAENAVCDHLSLVFLPLPPINN